MKIFIIGVAIIVALILLAQWLAYRHAIRHGRCPICGARIRHYANTQFSGMMCTECDWFNIEERY